MPAPVQWPPDGCPDLQDIAPPNGTIPFACLRSVTTDFYAEDGFTTYTLQLNIDHPEANGAPTWTMLNRTVSHKGGESLWHWQNSDWGATCGKDDAQLTWATLTYLNDNGATAAWRIYISPPPNWFVRKLDALILERFTNKRYFPFISFMGR